MNVMAIVAHPDDEIIGVGGTLLKHVQAGDKVFVLIVSEGKSSREVCYSLFDSRVLKKYIQETKNSLNMLGIKDFKTLNMPNNRLDGQNLLDIIKTIQIEIETFKPYIIYTHFYGDLNVDHQLVSKAVITAARTLPNNPTKEILLFETLSSTEQSLPLGVAFAPNLFIDISDQLQQKLLAMNCYQSELRSVPHPRSLKIIEQNASVWGAKCGVSAAEAFVVARILR